MSQFRIKHPTIMNLSLGAKVDWLQEKQIGGKASYVKNIFLAKGLGVQTGHWVISKDPQFGNSSKQQLLLFDPRNGKSISISKGSILRKSPLVKKISLHPLKKWMDDQNLQSLFDISKWSSRPGQWARQDLKNPLEFLHLLVPPFWNLFKAVLLCIYPSRTVVVGELMTTVSRFVIDIIYIHPSISKSQFYGVMFGILMGYPKSISSAHS